MDRHGQHETLDGREVGGDQRLDRIGADPGPGEHLLDQHVGASRNENTMPSVVTPESAWRAVLSAPASSHIDFAGSLRPTLGVEWEFALVDADSRDVSNEAAGVIEELGENNPHVHKELLRNTVEIVTGICDSVPQAMEDLRSTLVPRARSSAAGGWSCSAPVPIRSRNGLLGA